MHRLAAIAERIAQAEPPPRPVLKLSGPFSPYRGGGSDEIEVEREVRIESPALLAALTSAAPEGHAVTEEEMDGPHTFTVECEFTYSPGSPGGRDSPPDPAEAYIDDYSVVAVDGMKLTGADAEVATSLVELTDDEQERVSEAYVENYEPPFDPPDDYDDYAD